MIRPIQITDLPVLMALNENELGYQYPEDKARHQLQSLLADQGHHFLAAAVDDQNGEVQGYIHAEVYQEIYADTQLNILALAVAEKWKGQGVGTALITWLEDQGRQRHIAGILLNSGESRASAHRFYQNRGFTLVKKQMKFIKKII
ncbi:GNAT family N-acetyltransferase [Fructobacillus ficulneus]|uniref:Histone acetyltransferase HPA2 n=1 Tax=Fructobacillus ficulneus TaxID=157463 RepID=A0A0K8MJL9_9LACO|nr:GNAT family N-acetyltransferase [Fructobacillus ficulneus]GAP00374.1 histone acetyltransferase HPA2 [Fructobacillus ficulneus]